jgi:ATP-dependent Clp protease ATP-binding subunit ClpA
VFERYSELARQAVFIALIEARQAQAAAIDTDHLLIGILVVDPELSYQFALETLRNQSEQSLAVGPSKRDGVDLPLTSDSKQVMMHAASIADLHNCREIRTEHLFASLLEGRGSQAAKILTAYRIERQEVSKAISKVDCGEPQKPTEESRRATSSIIAKMRS